MALCFCLENWNLLYCTTFTTSLKSSLTWLWFHFLWLLINSRCLLFLYSCLILMVILLLVVFIIWLLQNRFHLFLLAYFDRVGFDGFDVFWLSQLVSTLLLMCFNVHYNTSCCTTFEEIMTNFKFKGFNFETFELIFIWSCILKVRVSLNSNIMSTQELPY